MVLSTAPIRQHRRRLPPEVTPEVQANGALRFYVPIFHREFDYELLGRAIGSRKAQEIAQCTTIYCVRFSRKTAIAVHSSIVNLAKFICEHPELSSGLKRAKALNTGDGGELWRQAVYLQVVEMTKVRRELTSFVEAFGYFFRLLDELSSLGLTSICAKPKLPANYHASGKQRPTLLEQSGMENIHEDAMQAIEKQVKELDLEIDSEQTRNILLGLATQIPIQQFTDSAALAEAVYRANKKTLVQIREVAESKFIKWRQVWEDGQKLLSESDSCIAKHLHQALQLPKGSQMRELSKFVSPNIGQVAVANILRYFADYHKGQVPAGNKYRCTPIFLNAINQLGGRAYLDAMLSLHKEAVAAAILIFLVDSGTNVSVALTLRTDSEKPRDDNFVEYVAYKDRAGPEPVVKALPIHDPAHKVTAVQALRDVKKMTQSRREAFPELGEQLFIYTYFNKPSIATNDFLLNNFRYMLSEAQLPQSWSPSAIRVAFAVEMTSLTGGNLHEVGRSLQQTAGSTSTPIYALRMPLRILCNKKIAEFQTLFEAALATHAPRGLMSIGYEQKAAEALLSRAVNTGMGFLCNPEAISNLGIATGKSCTKVGSGCPNCSARLYVLTVDALAETIAVFDALHAKLETFEESQPQHWKDTWLDLYAFSYVVIEKTKTSKFAHLLPKAQKLAKSMTNAGFDPLLIHT